MPFRSLFSRIALFALLVVPSVANAKMRCKWEFLKSYMALRFEMAENHIRDRPEGIEGWIFDGDRSPSYAHNFGGFWPRASFEALLQERKKKGLNNHVLDMMGSGVFTPADQENLDSITGVRLLPLRRDMLPYGFPHPKWRELIGNIYSRKPWAALEKRLNEVGTENFDVIVFRPAGGLLAAKQYAGVGIPIAEKAAADMLLIRRAYEMLSEEGQIFFEHELVPTGEIDAWVKEMRDAGLTVERSFDYTHTMFPVMAITKHTGAPEEMP